VRPGDCAVGVSTTKCVSKIQLKPKTLAQYCMTRWFLWWSWWDCGSTQGAYNATGVDNDQIALNPKFTTISYEDNDQFYYNGAYSGCGPNAGKNLLKWWQTQGGVSNTLRPATASYTAEQNTQIDLMGDMGAYISGNGRSVNSSGCNGMRQYLTKNNIPLGVACAEGIWVTTGWFQQLKDSFEQNIPVAVSHFVIGYGGHVGIAKWFRSDPYGNLYVKVFNNPLSFQVWNLAEVFAGSGMYYLYKL
jgi:hypothetical protein